MTYIVEGTTELVCKLANDVFINQSVIKLAEKYKWSNHNINDYKRVMRVITTSKNQQSDFATNQLLYELLPFLFKSHLDIFNKFTLNELKDAITNNY